MQLKQALSKLILVVLWVAVLGVQQQVEVGAACVRGNLSFGNNWCLELSGNKHTESNKDLHTFFNLSWDIYFFSWFAFK